MKNMKNRTLGQIANDLGFDSITDYISEIDRLVDVAKKNSFNVGDKVKLKKDFKPTHFNDEKILPLNTEFVISEKSNFTLDNYSIKIEGFEEWFCASVFESCE